MYYQTLIVLVFIVLSSCSTSSHLVSNPDQWQALSKIEEKEVLDQLGSQEIPLGSMRHRINLHTKLDKKSFEQSFISKGGLFSLSFFAPAYLKILYRIVEGSDQSILIDYQNKLVFGLDPSNSINLGDDKLPGMGRVYPEILEGQISKKSIKDIADSNYFLRKHQTGELILLEIKQNNYRREYLFEALASNRYCLKEALVELSEDNSSIIYKASGHGEEECVPSKILITPEFTSAYLEAILLIKQNSIQESPYPFSTETPTGFYLR